MNDYTPDPYLSHEPVEPVKKQRTPRVPKIGQQASARKEQRRTATVHAVGSPLPAPGRGARVEFESHFTREKALRKQ